MELLSIVTVLLVVAGTVPLTEAGVVNVFGCQSSRKKPIVLAIGGSIAGAITTVVSTGVGDGMPLLFLLHEIAKN